MFKGSLRMGVMCQGAAVRLTMTNRLGIALKSVCRARTKQMFTTFYNRHTRIPHRRRERRQRDESRAKKKNFLLGYSYIFLYSISCRQLATGTFDSILVLIRFIRASSSFHRRFSMLGHFLPFFSV